MGVGPSDYLHPLILTGQEAAVTKSFQESLDAVNSIRCVDLHQVPSFIPLGSHGQKSDEFDQARCNVLQLPKSFEEYLLSIGKSLRSDIKKGVATQGEHEIQWSTEHDVDHQFEDFLRLHKLRWKRRALPGVFFGKTRRFQREWIKSASRNGWLWLSVLRIEGKAVGALYAMTLGQSVYFYQSGIDSTVKGYSPGTILIAATISKSIEEGKTWFDFMRGDEAYKLRWKPTLSRTNRRIVMYDGSHRGRILRLWTSISWRVECAVRKNLEGARSPKGAETSLSESKLR